MKKIVFFIVLCFSILPNRIQAKSIENVCQNGELEVIDDLQSGLSVVKRGPDPFITVLDGDGGSLYIKGFLCTDTNIALYGYSHFPGNETYYEGYVILLDNMGNELYRRVYDYGELEEVVDVVYFDYVYGIVVHQLSYTEEPEFMMSYVHILDSDFQDLSTYTYNKQIYKTETKGNVFALQFLLEDEFQVGILSNLEEVFPNQIFSFEDHYQEPLTIPYINSAYINGEEIVNGVTITYPGNYEYVYNDQVYHFVMEPIISGITDKEMYYEPVSIHVQEGNVLLNGEAYTNNTIISEPGFYYLEVLGAGDYRKELTFTVGSMIEGLVNGFEYEDPITVRFTGQGFLNSNQVTSPIIVDQQGDYVFRVLGENGYSEEYHFSISYEQKFDMIAFIQKIDIFIMVGVVIAGVVIIKKSK